MKKNVINLWKKETGDELEEVIVLAVLRELKKKFQIEI